jgi:hypothetical protein
MASHAGNSVAGAGVTAFLIPIRTPALKDTDYFVPRGHAGYELGDLPEPAGEDFSKAVAVLLPYLLSHRTRLAASLPPDDHEADAAAAAAAAASSGGGGSAAADQASDSAAKPQGLQEEEEAAAASGGPGDRDARVLRDAEVAGMSGEQRRQLAEAVDTAILKARAAVLSLLLTRSASPM